MEEKLDLALNRVLGGKMIAKGTDPPKVPESGEISDLGKQALNYYNNAKEYLRKGDWAGYGRELQKLESILQRFSEASADKE